jgi:hypothetical protein
MSVMAIYRQLLDRVVLWTLRFTSISGLGHNYDSQQHPTDAAQHAHPDTATGCDFHCKKHV